MGSGAGGNNENGATTVETAVTIFPFMLVILGLIQITLFSFNLASIQYSLNRAARFGLLGVTLAGQPSREASILKRFEETANALSIDTTGVSLKICPVANPGCATNNAGGSGQYVVLTATKVVQSILGFGDLSVSAKVLVRNEPF